MPQAVTANMIKHRYSVLLPAIYILTLRYKWSGNDLPAQHKPQKYENKAFAIY